MVHGVNKERKDYGMSYSCLITAGRKEGESKNLMNTENKRVSTRRNESKEAPERKRLLERSAFQWAMSLLTSAFGTALTLYLIHRL